MDARVLCLLFIACLLALPSLPGRVHASGVSQPSTFYFHKQTSKTINAIATTLWANTTTLWPSSTQTEQRNLGVGIATFDFYSQPSLKGNVTIQGFINFTIYFGASSNTGGGTVITATLREVNSTGASTFVSSSSLPGQVHTAIQPYALSLFTSSWQLQTNDILDFTITVNAPSTNAQLTLYYDNPSTPSNAIVDFQAVLGFSMSATFDSTGVPSQGFNKNATSSSRKILVQATLFDALGLYDFKSVAINITNPSGGFYLSNAPLALIVGSSSSYITTWEFNITYSGSDPSGTYRINIGAVDNSGVVVSSPLSYSLFATWILTIHAIQPDQAQTPVPGVQVTVFTSGTAIYFGISDSTGYVAPQAILPDNFTYTVDSYWNGILVNQTNLFRPASISLSIIIPLYQVDFSKSFFDASGETLQTPPSSFHLIYPDGSYAEPNSTAVDSLPAGTYTVSNIIWDEVDVTPSTTSFDPTYGTPVFDLRIYELSARVVDQSNHPVEGAQVILFLNGVVIAQGTTDYNGTILVHDLPIGQLVVIAKRSGQSDYGRAEISLLSNTSVQVQLPLEAVEYSIITSIVLWVIVGISLVATASWGIIWYRRVSRSRRARGITGPESKA